MHHLLVKYSFTRPVEGELGGPQLDLQELQIFHDPYYILVSTEQNNPIGITIAYFSLSCSTANFQWRHKLPSYGFQMLK